MTLILGIFAAISLVAFCRVGAHGHARFDSSPRHELNNSKEKSR